ncbi:hypothetical protein BDY21DRAFT_287969 [Lineolata rhizophorae]|uniref:RING-type domain-containing protein n=1 Tax=Lineolata rhizophorae TaxID=578093 RepID=A0A6A6NXP1_9PEZI|nr:hypothetical protein BDY21DRAFT_287969 [Lineolata rhizophorae]
MAHSKRNTSLAFFTAHERNQLRTHWGSQSSQLTRDSFLPFGSCLLCLLPARDPVACGIGGEIFCRECAVSNLLAQRDEIARAGREKERREKEEEERRKREEEEEREREIKEFEAVQAGLERRRARSEARRGVRGEEKEQERERQTKGTKRKFELDEEELSRVAREDRLRARREMSEEKKEAAAKAHLPSFWVPSQTPNADANTESSSAAPKATSASKPTPLCPASVAATNMAAHPFSLKSLVTVQFSTEKDSKTGDSVPSCPACRKSLSNATKAMLAIPCGHVLCLPCTKQFLPDPSSSHKLDPHDPHDPAAAPPARRCYVCEADLSGGADDTPADKKSGKEGKKHKKHKKDKGGLKPGMVQIRSEGTGYAGGGKNVVKKEGVAFQC